MGLKKTMDEMRQQALEAEAEEERRRQEEDGTPIQWDESVEFDEGEDMDPSDLDDEDYEPGEVREDDDAMDPEDLDEGSDEMDPGDLEDGDFD